MARLIGKNDEVLNIAGTATGAFKFSAAKPSSLGATEYTLVTIACDISGSVNSFKGDLEACIKTIIDSCKKSPRCDNLLIRVITFDDTVEEIHGFKQLQDIDLNDYALHPGGMTALNEAAYSAIGATITYGETLSDQDFDVNAICFVITDGGNNMRGPSCKDIANLKPAMIANEKMESLINILIGVNVNNPSIKQVLSTFNTECNFDQYVDLDDATSQTLAKLASFVSRSISSQSQSLGTGGPSQTLTF